MLRKRYKPKMMDERAFRLLMDCAFRANGPMPLFPIDEAVKPALLKYKRARSQMGKLKASLEVFRAMEAIEGEVVSRETSEAGDPV